MQTLSCSTETVLSNKIIENRTVPSFKDSPRKPLDGDLNSPRPSEVHQAKEGIKIREGSIRAP